MSLGRLLLEFQLGERTVLLVMLGGPASVTFDHRSVILINDMQIETFRCPTNKYSLHGKSHNTKSKLESSHTQVPKLTVSAV